jgi:hypothetical protein
VGLPKRKSLLEISRNSLELKREILYAIVAITEDMLVAYLNNVTIGIAVA